tara:strand:+ start:1198 stop:2904 length:1707 start_codon:yes stop_codon:yes gene_type:complete
VTCKDGPFFKYKNTDAPMNPYGLLVAGITLSALVIAYHFISFKSHIDEAQNKINIHIEQMEFVEKFYEIDEALSITARTAMAGTDRTKLAVYLENEDKLQNLIDERFEKASNDPETRRVLIELRRTMRDLMNLESGSTKVGEQYFLTPEYLDARMRIRQSLKKLSDHLLINRDEHTSSFKILNDEFMYRTTEILIGLIGFWLVFGMWLKKIKTRFDLTQRHRKRERQILESLIQSIPNGVVAIDRKGRFTLWNREASRIAPKGPEQLPLKAWDKMSLTTNQAEDVKFEDKILRFNGAPLRDTDGTYLGGLLIFEDVTQQRLVAKELEQEREKQIFAAKMATLGEVAGNLAHEINTPLATVQISAEGISAAIKKNDSVSAKIYLDCISKASKRMNGIVTAFLKYSRVDGRDEKHEVIDIREVIQETMEICGPDLKSKGVALLGDIPAEPIMVECKPGSLTQAVINLITNARDAAVNVPKGWVKLSVNEQKGWVVIDVEDAGSGVKTDLIKQIFEPNFSSKPRGKGNGLGLGIVRQVARSHGGDVQHHLKDGHTCFEIKFPSFVSTKHII